MAIKVICIDDEAHNNQSLKRLLRKKFDVATTESPSEALKYIEKEQPEIIISDQRMPQMTGTELLQKSKELSPKSIRILLTGYTDLESVIDAINDAQIYRYLTKPWEPNDLLQTLEQALETYQLRDKVYRQNEVLKNLDQLKRNFMLLISHELRTPVTAISSFLEILSEEIQSPEQRKYISYIDKNTNRIKSLIEDILLITNINTLSSSINSKELPLSKVFSKDSQTESNIKDIRFQHEHKIGEVHTDEKYFRIILNRIFDNCKKYSQKQSTVYIKSFSSEAYDIIEFTNTSENPLPSDLNFLTQAFHKNENIMNHTQGVGLGLSVVNSLCQRLNIKFSLTATQQELTQRFHIPRP